jgi:asparagine synthetase B (glutamine-hydrolysing)
MACSCAIFGRIVDASGRPGIHKPTGRGLPAGCRTPTGRAAEFPLSHRQEAPRCGIACILNIKRNAESLRASKSTAAWELATRVPYFDREFLDVATAFDPAEKRVGAGRMETYPLRRAFEGYLPDEFPWRPKDQFSDGVGYAWIDALKAHAAQKVSDAQVSVRDLHRAPG